MANRLKKRYSAKSIRPSKFNALNIKDFKKERKESSLSMLYKKKRVRIVGLVLMAFAFFLTLASISFMFTWWKDADLIAQKGVDFLFLHNISVDNIMGRMGLWCAYYLVYRGFGIPSLLLCWLLFNFGAFLFFKNYPRLRLSQISFMVVLMLYFSVLLDILFYNSTFYYGGYVGAILVQWMGNFLGIVGLISLLVIALLIYVIWKWNLLVSYETLRVWLGRMRRTVSSETMQDAGMVADQVDKQNKEEGGDMSNVNDDKIVDTSNEADTDISPESLPTELRDTNPTIGGTTSLPVLDIKAVEQEIELLDRESPLPVRNKEVENINHTQATTPQSFADKKERTSSTNEKLHTSESDIDFTVQVTDDTSKEEKDLTRLVEINSSYKLPPVSLLKHYDHKEPAYNKQELQEYKNQIIQTLKHFGIHIQKIAATVGPTVTLYEIVPEDGTRISKIKNLENDIALSLSALGIRIIAPIPGKGTIGIEVPNRNKKLVGLRSLIGNKKFIDSSHILPVALGKKVDNENYIVDLAKMPHLLMAGATGQGKSVGLNTLLLSLLYKKSPSELKFVLIDPKKVELSLFRNLERHFLAKLPGESEAIITDTKQVIHTLNALCIEMDNRYDLLKAARCRNIIGYNMKWGDKKLETTEGHHFLPYIVLVIDEFADLIMTAGKEVELPIARLAQLARAVGIHLVIATQRPSVNIITGMIKANFPARLAFKVSSKVDSRTILDTGGAEQLVGKGDMLFFQGNELIRLQCAFVETSEVDDVCSFISDQPWQEEAYLLPVYEEEEGAKKETPSHEDKDALLEEAARLVVNAQSGSTSLIQRKMRLGFNRAGRLMDQLETFGIVSPPKGSKPRDVLVQTEAELENIFH